MAEKTPDQPKIIVLDFRELPLTDYTTLHNLIIVYILHCFVAAYSLIPIHFFGSFRAAPSTFQHIGHLLSVQMITDKSMTENLAHNVTCVIFYLVADSTMDNLLVFSLMQYSLCCS